MELNERVTLTVEETARLLGISRAKAYDCVRTGEIPSIRFGRRRLVPRIALDRMLDPRVAPALIDESAQLRRPSATRHRSSTEWRLRDRNLR